MADPTTKTIFSTVVSCCNFLGATFAYRPVSGPLRTHNVYTFQSTAGGTQITLIDEIELSGLLGLLEPVMARVIRRQYQENLARLKSILEAQPARGA